MGKPAITFSKLIDKLQQHYGPPATLPSNDPLELIIWENIAYLATDNRRAEAFAILKQTIGTRPEQILTAQHSALASIGKAGILPDVSAEKLLTIAKIGHIGNRHGVRTRSISGQRQAIDLNRSSLKIPVFKSVMFSAFAHDHEEQAPIDRGSINASASPAVQLHLDSRDARPAPGDLGKR